METGVFAVGSWQGAVYFVLTFIACVFSGSQKPEYGTNGSGPVQRIAQSEEQRQCQVPGCRWFSDTSR